MFVPKHLYIIKNQRWLVFPNQGVAELVGVDRNCFAFWAGSSAKAMSERWSEQLGCLIGYIEPGSNFMVLEVDGYYVKVVGDKVGWIVADMTADWIKESFEEITSP